MAGFAKNENVGESKTTAIKSTVKKQTTKKVLIRYINKPEHGELT